MNGLRRLYSDYQLLNNADNEHQSVKLWNTIFRYEQYK